MIFQHALEESLNLGLRRIELFAIQNINSPQKSIQNFGTVNRINATRKTNGIQWDFAKFLFDKDEGDKYSIFIVQYAGKANAKLIPLNNPVKMWLDGNLSMLKIELAI